MRMLDATGQMHDPDDHARPPAPAAAGFASSPDRWRWPRRWLAEPLVQFLLIGAALFLGYQALHPGPQAGASSTRIELTQDDLRQMSVAWLAQGRPAPTPDQMRSLVDMKVREEILYREALALGLDKDDTIVKRRLAQKMEFLFEDVSALREPTREELKAWFEKNSDRFALAPRASFRHLYFSPDRRGARAREDAALALTKLRGKAATANGGATLADPFMFQDYFGDRSFEEMAKLFGPRFAQALLQQQPGSWQGPIESGYGWHLVWVDSLTSVRVPAFEEIETDVREGWIADQRTETRRRAYEAMRARYEIVLPGLAKQDVSAAGAPSLRKVP
jgi:peptidyl-prolyl cis-trans isomerase C